jgi:hypothetical protein
MSRKNLIQSLLVELSHKSVGVPEFLKLAEENPDIIDFLNFKTLEELSEYVYELGIEFPILLDAFQKSKEIYLTKKIKDNLENTEANQIKKGQMDKVNILAKNYGKKDPKKLKIELSSDNYDRPLVLNYDGRYYLVAGNTRLATASAMGIKPKIYLATL